MLKRLSIRNYALIDELEISFSKGLTIITGETGAGKSILLGALSLLLGSRADSAALADKTKKCIVEGDFEIGNHNLADFFKQNDLDFDVKTTVRREISSEGKSRAFVNDTPVNLSILRELGQRFIEIHSQHETLTLNNSSFQMMVVDNFAGSGKLLSTYKSEYLNYIGFSEKLNGLKEMEAKSKADLDYFSFLFNELDEAQLKTGEQEILENELLLLSNSEEIKSSFSGALNIVNGEESSVISAITNVQNIISNTSKIFPKAEELAQRIKSVQIEIKDIASEIEALERDVVFSPGRIEIINDRLNLVYKLQQKHRVNSIDNLIAIRNDLDNKLAGIGTLEEEIKKLEKAVSDSKEELFKKGTQLSALRRKSIAAIEKTVKEMLALVGMPHAVLKVDLQPLPDGVLRATGIDQVRLLFSANKGVEFRELDKVASGGELSRLMLCIKSLIAKHTGLPTIIFDEIDTGVSGEIAHKVGNIVKEMSGDRQVVAITHLPQMASKGDDHLFVYKETGSKTTVTRIKKLTKPERVEEIAKMLSGDQPTKAAIANAKELLEA